MIRRKQDWTIDTFNIANEQACNDLRDFLRTNGVFVNADPKKKVQYALNDVLNEDKPHIWTNTEVEEVMEEFPQQFDSKYNPDLETSDQRSRTHFSPKLAQENIQYQERKPDFHQIQEQQRITQNPTYHNYSSHTPNPITTLPIIPRNPNNKSYQNPLYPQHYSIPQSQPSKTSPQYTQPWPINPPSSGTNTKENLVSQAINNIPGSTNIGRELGTLQRIYQADMQYGGTNDDFDL
ncbi:hypothetical protein OnM2_105032, partial [Erysiphe neolycopersici]